ncbi:MAG: hypothetical protein ACK5MP_14135 [Nostocoides sp.]
MTRSVTVSAPVRVCDVGGWTDTWFGGPGAVCHIAVAPGVTVRGRSRPQGGGPARVVVSSADLGRPTILSRAGAAPDMPWLPQPGSDPLLVATCLSVLDQVPDWSGQALIEVDSAVPAGASLGTSGAVLVGMIAAMRELVALPRLSPAMLAATAHTVETVRAHREAGVQDQWAAAYGGVGLLRIEHYPRVVREEVPVPEPMWSALAEALVTVCFTPHDSSAVHQAVIADVTSRDRSHGGPVPGRDTRIWGVLIELSDLARAAAAALGRADLTEWARVLTAATAAQARLHPSLVGPDHMHAIEVGRAAGSLGWKVNGAGGAGGSLTLLARQGQGATLRAALQRADPSWTVLDVQPTRCGLTYA